MLIDYSLIGKAMDFYKDKGYTPIELDWMVRPDISALTTPFPWCEFRTIGSDEKEYVLVGSAEQSFLQAVYDRVAELDTLYVSVTPCFRRGDIGLVNQETFMKVELSAATSITYPVYKKMLSDAQELFQALGVDRKNLIISKESDTQFDIIYSKEYTHLIDSIDNDDWSYPPDAWLELGSYGVRSLKGLQTSDILVHYGTGLALPRFQLTQT